MKLSAPIYRLKRRARALSRNEKIALNSALDRIALEEGFASWSLLASRASKTAPARQLYARLTPGNLVLLAARPGHGKTMLGVELVLEAIRAGHRGIFFTLEYTIADLAPRLATMGVEQELLDERFTFDDSDDIEAGYIMRRLATAQRGTLAVVDYLQLLDQKRENPDLMTQIRELKAFARQQGIVIAFIAQIHRSFEASGRPCPGFGDIRLPNPLDLTLFDKTCFLNDGEIRVSATVDPS